MTIYRSLPYISTLRIFSSNIVRPFMYRNRVVLNYTLPMALVTICFLTMFFACISKMKSAHARYIMLRKWRRIKPNLYESGTLVSHCNAQCFVVLNSIFKIMSVTVLSVSMIIWYAFVYVNHCLTIFNYV